MPMTSPKFTTQLMSMRQAATAAPVPAKKTISKEGFTFSNMMGMMMMMMMMMMNQQQEQEAAHEERSFRE